MAKGQAEELSESAREIQNIAAFFGLRDGFLRGENDKDRAGKAA
jgi:hypothetical protein